MNASTWRLPQEFQLIWTLLGVVREVVERGGLALYLWQGEHPANILLLVRYFSGNIIAQTDRFILANNSTLAGNNLVCMKRMPIFLTISRGPLSFNGKVGYRKKCQLVCNLSYPAAWQLRPCCDSTWIYVLSSSYCQQTHPCQYVLLSPQKIYNFVIKIFHGILWMHRRAWQAARKIQHLHGLRSNMSPWYVVFSGQKSPWSKKPSIIKYNIL